MSKKPSEKKSKATRELLQVLQENSEPGHAIQLATALENILKRIFTDFLHDASNTLRDKLFKYGGPLGGFSSKIDLARALGIIDAAMCRDLHAFRDVRNAFAHPPMERLKFSSPSILKEMARFEGFKTGLDPYIFFVDRYISCVAALSSIPHRGGAFA